MSKVCISLNDYVFVEVTDYGWERAEEYHSKLCNDAEHGRRYVEMMKSHTKDYMTLEGRRRLTAMQFREFLNTFGHLAYLGGENFIKDCKMFLEYQVNEIKED